MPETIYLAVEDSELELPLMVADTKHELETGLGIYEHAVYLALRHNGTVKLGDGRRIKFYAINTTSV